MMASRSQTSKAMLDIEDCITELKRFFLNEKTPINDDSPVLHRFEEKLEAILLLGLKEKPGVFGGKRSYWDYISACFSCSKRLHQGLKFVKSNSELKSSLGRGRALIRFCLMQKCLADTLQSCFIDHKTTRDFYSEQCLPLQPKLWSSFITCLYDLNEINFDLNPQHAELDVSWPSFARKLFISSENQTLPSRNLSSSSLTHCSLQVNGNDLNILSEKEDDGQIKLDSELDSNSAIFLRKFIPEHKAVGTGVWGVQSEETQNLVEANSELEADVLYLQKKCETLEKEICCAVHEENVNQGFELVPEDLEIFSPENTLEDLKVMNNNYCYQANSLNDSKDGTKHIDMELNFNLKQDVQCACNLKCQLSSEKNCKMVQNVSSFCDNSLLGENVSYPGIPKLSKMPNTLKCPLTSEQLNSEIVSVTPKHDTTMNEVDSSDLRGNNCADKFLKKTDSFRESPNETLNLGQSDSANELFLEMKSLIDNLSNSMQSYTADPEILSHFTRLETIRESLETIQFKKLSEYEIQKQNLDDYAYCTKSLALKQECLIDSVLEKVNSSVKENESLYDKVCFLKDRLHSYGLLKLQTESDPNIQNRPLLVNKDTICLSNNSGEDINYNVEFCDHMSKNCLESLHIFKKSSLKLSTLNMQATALQLWLDSSHKLNNNLISRVQDQEMHMKGITKELEEAHHLLSVMRKQHQKLQSAENIIKYDLQEKRKLLTRLKQQLEATREDCNLVRIKNSKSEVEWQNLRKEFVQRNKQTSEESGFIDDKGIGDHCTPITSTCEYIETNNTPNNETCLEKSENIKHDLKQNRLQMLEEQCKLLCSNLINSSKKREEIDCRLESWCKAIEKSREETPQPEKLTESFDIDLEHKNSSGGILEKVTIDSISDVDESLSSSDIGSLNSDCSDIPHNSTTISADVSFSLPPLNCNNPLLPKIVNKECNQNEIIPECINFQTKSNQDSKESCNSLNHASIENIGGISCCSSIESLEEIEDCSLKNLNVSEVRRRESEEIIECKKLSGAHFSEKENSCLETGVILKLQEEKRILEARCEELEKKYVIISSQLSQQMQQLKLTEVAKEREITALRFQLNSEVLKYERALKDISENNYGLKDMKQKVNDQEQLILTLEEALAEIQVERESEKDHQWEQLQDIQLALAAREEECILLSADLDKLEDFKNYCLRDRESMDAEITHLRSDSKALQKKIIKLLKEKDILWKRNDYLTYKQKIQIDDRWMADHEVSECLGCRSHFSFLLRKHHCRQCGRIFCNSCSNNWLLTASSSKQLRVCNECYMQHLEIKKDVRRDSNVQCCDDSEDEAVVDDVSLTLNRSISFSSEIHPSIANSIVSLPVMQETNLKQKSHFTSAPELHMATKNYEVPKTNSMNDPVLTSQIEAAKSGMDGDVLIKASEKTILPVLNEGNSTSLHWSFTPNNEAIPISLIYEDLAGSNTQQTVLHQSACETEGVMHLSLPGLYKFHFDNRSRMTSISMHYTFKATVENQEEIYG